MVDILRNPYIKAFYLGVSAHFNGKDIEDNPYSSNPADTLSYPCRVYWLSGWSNALTFKNSKPMLTYSNPKHSPPGSDLTYAELEMLQRLSPVWDDLKKSLGRDLDFLLEYMTDVFIMTDDVEDYSGLIFFNYRGHSFEYGILTDPIYLRSPSSDIEYSSFDELRSMIDALYPPALYPTIPY